MIGDPDFRSDPRLTMPSMSGEETFRQLRTIRPNVRVILSSGHNEIEGVKRFTPAKGNSREVVFLGRSTNRRRNSHGQGPQYAWDRAAPGGSSPSAWRHGFDPCESPTMNGIFYAVGPNVKPSLQLPTRRTISSSSTTSTVPVSRRSACAFGAESIREASPLRLEKRLRNESVNQAADERRQRSRA
jgi:hypothetical protein